MHLHTQSKIYGAEVVILSLLKYLPKERFQPFLICLCHNSKESEFIDAARRLYGVEVIPIYMEHKNDISAIKKLRSLLRIHSIQILHTHGYKADIIGFLASLFLRMKLVSTLHGWIGIDAKLRFNNMLAKQSLKFFHRIIAVSEALQQETIKYINKRKVICIRNAVDMDYLNRVKPLNLSEILRVEKGDTFVTYVGRLSSEKGVDHLVEAASLINKKNAKITFIFIGEGPMKSALEELRTRLRLDKKIRFAGYRKDALRILKSSDLFVLPSLTEGMPMVCMEAMGLGMLVVATDVGGVSELIKDGVNGFLVPSKRPDLLAEKIEMALENSDQLGLLKTKATQTIKERFSTGRMAGQYAELYGALIGAR